MTAFDVYRGACNTWECDRMGHMNVQHYIQRMSHAWAHLRPAIGISADTLRKDRRTLVAVRDVVRYKRELHAGDPMHMTGRVAEVGDKTVRFFCELWKSETGELSASFDTTGLFVDLERRKAIPLTDDIRARAQALARPIPEMPQAPETDPALANAPESAFFETYRGAVDTWECDYLGHMNVQFYTDRFSHAASHVFSKLGFVRDGRTGSAAVQYDIRYLKEMKAGDPMKVVSVVLGAGAKTIRFGHRVVNLATGDIASTVDIVAVTFDLAARKAIPLPDAVRKTAEAALYSSR